MHTHGPEQPTFKTMGPITSTFYTTVAVPRRSLCCGGWLGWRMRDGGTGFTMEKAEREGRDEERRGGYVCKQVKRQTHKATKRVSIVYG